jgi:hypothetical protein
MRAIGGNAKYLDRLWRYITPPIREEFDVVVPALELISKHAGPSKQNRIYVLDIIVRVMGEMPCPEVPIAGAAVKVSLSANPEHKRARKGRPDVLELDAEGARRLRALFERGLAVFNRHAEASLAPGPQAPAQIRAWWESKERGKAIFAESQRELLAARGGAKGIAPGVPAVVVSATLLGSSGTEWLSGGGFLPDGTVVLAGTALGPRLDYSGIPTTVLGADGPPPPAVSPEQAAATADPRKGHPYFRWSHPHGTAFVVRLSPDLKRILSVARFPWGAGAASSLAVGAEGDLYLAGPARPALRALVADAKDLPSAKGIPPPASKDSKKPAAAGAPDPDAWALAYVARLGPDAASVRWIRFVGNPNGNAFAPEVRALDRDRLLFSSADYRILRPDGTQQVQWDPSRLPRMPSLRTAILPDAGLIVTASEHHWPTGHEPWRCPYVAIEKPDGTRALTLYDWPGPFIGGATGLVADSPLYGCRIDRQGDLLLLGWADGGNSVFDREPLDVMTGAARMKGLGLSASGTWGANNFGRLIRISTRTWKVIGGSLVTGRAPQGNPSGFRCDEIAEAVDGSVMTVGNAAYGYPQTTNHIATGDPAGPFVMVTTRDVDALRFSSAMAACAEARVGNANWALASGSQGGKPMALFLTGARPKGVVYGAEYPPPSVNPVQSVHAGGVLDGYLLLLNLEAP